MHRALRGEVPRLGHHSGTSVDAAHPYLNIHSASFTGNFGLVSYALTSGVPPSAVLDGLTPLHAACAGTANNEAVVNYLIEHGADVNAPRGGSRRGSAENSKTPRVGGAVGYTPLHYAVASGNANIVPILLAAGADPTIPDKHGVLPHHLAKQTGRGDIETLLFDALTKRASTSGSPGSGYVPTPPSPRLPEKESKRLAMKKSLESVLYPSRYNQPHPSDSAKPLLGAATPPSPYTTEIHGGALSSNGSSGGTRLPSIPSDQQFLPPSPPRVSSSSSSHSKDKRPRSAGASNPNSNDSFPQSPSASAGSGIAQTLGKKLGTKYSLLNVLRRNTDDQVTTSDTQGQPPTHTQWAHPHSHPPTPPPHPSPWERKASLPDPAAVAAAAAAVSLSVNPTASPTVPRPGILKPQLEHRRSSSNSLKAGSGHNGTTSPGSSTEVSRKTSTRTLRFEDQTPSPSLNGGSWSALSSISGRKASDASERGPGSDYMMVRRPSEHSVSMMSPIGGVEEEGAEGLKRLAFVNSTRARAGTFGTVTSSSSGTGSSAPPSASAVDIPIPPGNTSPSMTSTMRGSPSSPGSASGSPSPFLSTRRGPEPEDGNCLEGDPEVPEYSSDLSEDEQEPPEVPTKDSDTLQAGPVRKVTRKVSASGYPEYHSSTVTDEDDQVQYARYDVDGEFMYYDEAEPPERPRGIWSSPAYSYTFSYPYAISPISAPATGTGTGPVHSVGSPPATSLSSASATFNHTPTSASTSAHSPTFSIRSHRDARHLVQQVQKEILASAQVGARNLSEQLAAYGETLAIERRFAIGERQRWKNAGMEEDEEARVGGLASTGRKKKEEGSVERNGTVGDEDDSGGRSAEGGEEADEEREMKERASLRMRERERGEREQASSGLGHVASYGSLKRSNKSSGAPMRPTLKPLVNRRPHSSSGVSTQGKEGSITSSTHRSTRSATAPLIHTTDEVILGNTGSLSPEVIGPGIEIVKTIPTPQGSNSPASERSIEPPLVPSSYIQSYSFTPSSPLRQSLDENGDLMEDSRPVRERSTVVPTGITRGQYPHHHTLSGASAKASYAVNQTPSMSVDTSILPPLSPILSESSSATTFTYPIKRKSKALPIPSPVVATNTLTPPRSPTSPGFFPPPIPPHDYSASPEYKFPRKSFASDRSGGSSKNSTESLGNKGQKKRFAAGLKMFVQTIKGERS